MKFQKVFAGALSFSLAITALPTNEVLWAEETHSDTLQQQLEGLWTDPSAEAAEEETQASPPSKDPTTVEGNSSTSSDATEEDPPLEEGASPDDEKEADLTIPPSDSTASSSKEGGVSFDGLTNIAKDAVITAIESPASISKTDSSNLVDGDLGSANGLYKFYCAPISSLNGDPAWIELAYDKEQSIGGFRLAVEENNKEADITFVYDILGKTSNGDFVKLVENGRASRTGGNHIQTHALDTLTNLSTIRIEIKATEGIDAWPILAEFEVYADAPATPEEPEDPEEPPSSDLLQVAAQCEITVLSEQAGKGKGNLVDGNKETLWVNNGADWPNNIDFQLPGNMLIKKVEVDFEQVDGRQMKVGVSRAVNNVTSDYQKLYEATAKFTDGFVYEMEDAQRMTHLRLTLSDPSPSSLWPAVAEVRIYAVNEDVPLEKFANITQYSTITSIGGEYNTDQKENLRDGKYDTLYQYYGGVFSSIPDKGPAWVDLTFDGTQQVKGFEIAFEKETPGQDAVTFTYDILGRTDSSQPFTPYVTNATAKRAAGENVKQHKLNFLTGMSEVRIAVKECSSITAWPALAEFKIFGEYSEPVKDLESIAWKKPVHSNSNAATAFIVNDGNRNTSWKSEMYPAYVDIDLEANYSISEIQVFTNKEGYANYSIYTSLNNRDFSLVGEKQDNKPCPEDGDLFPQANIAARYVRVYLEYNSQSTAGELREVRVLGKPSDVALQETPPITVANFNETKYNAPLSAVDAINEVQQIIRRNVGSAYVDWFTFEVKDGENGYDYFLLEDSNGKIKVTGNDGVSLATGVNHYLKYFCNVHISQVGSQITMPSQVVSVGTPVRKETRFPVRYAYNYCTHSYSMPFWGQEEWQVERDWLALNGVNLVLDITAQEEVWRRFLGKIGYTHQEAKDFIAGPAYYAWAYMANLTGFGGPVHDSWFEKRTELARENQLAMRKLGMDVCLQAYSGMVPVDLSTKNPDVASDIIPQATWCSFRRPDMLRTNSPTFDQYAEYFYQAQEEVFGKTAKYYATDPFHEGGNTGDMSTVVVSQEVMNSLLAYNSDAVWVIQSWQGNPSNGLLEGLRTPEDRRDHAIVLDLYAEKTENWKTYGTDTDGDGLKEFSDTPWVFCQLNNFGGRMGLHGHLDNLAKNIPAAANQTKHLKGIGISPEASQNNPLLYDFLFETVWTADASADLPEIDVSKWLADYAHRRYGAVSEKAVEALTILSNTVYKASLNMKGQGAPESVINARPALSISAASTWGNAVIDYNKTELEKAARLLLEDYTLLSQSDAYLYDLADILKQVLSNTAQEVQKEMAAAYQSTDAEEFDALSSKYLELIDAVEKTLGTRKEFLFGTWTTNASELADGADDFTKRLYLLNAKSLVTTWGSIQQSESGGLKDYSNRQWAGLTNDFYKARWQMWINAAKAELSGSAAESINWFQWEWQYARDQKPYSNQPNTLSLQTLGSEILEKYTAPVEPPEPTGENDIDPTTTTATAGSMQEGEGPERAVDNDSATIWHSAWAGATDSERYLTIDLGKEKTVNGVRYQPRQDGVNGIVTQYEVLTSLDNETWKSVAKGKWAANSRWKLASFDALPARYVRLNGVATIGNENNLFMSAAEVHVTAPPKKQYTVTFQTNGGSTIAPITVEENQTITKPANPTKSNYTFTGWYSDKELTKIFDFTTPIKEDITVYAAWKATSSGGSGGGSSGGGGTIGGGGSSSNSNTNSGTNSNTTGNTANTDSKTETSTDGSKTTVTTDKTTGSTSTTVVKPDGTTATTVKKGDRTESKVTIATDAITESNKSGGSTVSLPISGIKASTSSATAPTVEIALPKTKEPVNVAIPVENITDSTVAVLVKPDGTEQIIKKSLLQSDGSLRVALDSSATIKIVENNKQFTDVDSHWATKAITFVASRELFAGVSQEEFAPDQLMNRGMFVTVLYRLEDQPEAKNMQFLDIATDAYYSSAASWAAQQGIAVGSGEYFNPEDTITREQLVSMLYRLAGTPKVESAPTVFSDSDAVSPWAKDAMTWAVQASILTGKGNSQLAPQEFATRSEVATFIQRFVESINK